MGQRRLQIVKDPTDYNVRAVERALEIMCCFDDKNPERGISEIAQVVDLHKATTHRIVTTMVNLGFLERAGDGQKYRLGMQLAELGFQVIRRMDLRREALLTMSQLSESIDEACDLSVYDHGDVFYVEVIQSSHALTISARVGTRLPAHCTASGKIFLANLPEAELSAILTQPLRAFTYKTITSPDELRRQLAQIRQQDYAVDNEEFETGVRAVAAAVRNHDGAVIAAISIAGPSSRITPERITEMTGTLQEAAHAVSRRMGWMPG
jgi:IclR family transcriptional regulator, KDG regulon repressor